MYKRQAVASHLFLNEKVMISIGGHLGQMGHTDHLAVFCHLLELAPNFLSCPARDAGVHLIEDQGANLIFAGHDIFDGQHYPGNLAARGDFRQRLRRLPGVGGNQQLQIVLPHGSKDVYKRQLLNLGLL